MRYKNPLPPLPFAPKLLPNPTHAATEEQLTQQLQRALIAGAYGGAATQLSARYADWLRRYEMPLLAPYDLGIPLDLIRLRAYELSDAGSTRPFFFYPA